jgi:hypothetical protein
MPTVHFLGKVVPSNHYSTTMWDLPEVTYGSPDLNLQVSATVQIQGSAVDVKCEVNRWDSLAMTHVHKVAYDLARTAVNFVCFATGLNLVVFFDELIDPDGNKTGFIIHHPALGALCTCYTLGEHAAVTEMGTIIKLVIAEPQLFLALDDLITAGGHHHLLTVNSARAIEGLRHAMCGNAGDRNDQWKQFRTNLNLSLDYLMLITGTSASGRHGDGQYIPGTVTEEIMKRSWTIMNRFLEFKKRGGQPLPLSEFPVL